MFPFAGDTAFSVKLKQAISVAKASLEDDAIDIASSFTGNYWFRRDRSQFEVTYC